ncbi:MAG: DinB family protein, partial [Chloroflexota bacterium]
ADVGHNRMIFHYAEDKEFIPADYDIERYNQRSIQKQAEMTLSQARASLDKSRAEFIEWLDNVEDDSVLDKKGRHATLKMMTLTELMDVMIWHETNHAEDIQAVLDAQSE